MSDNQLEDGAPREQHYAFAHVALPEMLNSDAARASEVFAAGEGNAFLRWLWDQVGSKCSPEGLVPSEGLYCRVRAEGGRQVVVVHLPEPRRMTEAFMVALVFDPPTRGWFGRKKPGPTRYFTLELSTDLEGGWRTVLGEWNNRAHLNMGDGPPPEEDAFVEALTALY
jgi:hypothetical protein